VLVRPLCCHRRQPGDAISGIPVKRSCFAYSPCFLFQGTDRNLNSLLKKSILRVDFVDFSMVWITWFRAASSPRCARTAPRAATRFPADPSVGSRRDAQGHRPTERTAIRWKRGPGGVPEAAAGGAALSTPLNPARRRSSPALEGPRRLQQTERRRGLPRPSARYSPERGGDCT